MPRLVADASVVVAWLVQRPDSSSLRAALGVADLAAPAHFDAEALNALRGLVRAGKLEEARAAAALRLLAEGVIERHPIPPLLEGAWELRDNLPAYDALYVALAQELECPLLTTDRRLAGAPGLGIPVTVIDV